MRKFVNARVRGLFILLPLVLTLLLSASPVSADSGKNYSFATPKGLEGRVEFWRLIFAKYGDNHRVFHHRLYPEIIYSVLDFSEFEGLNPKASLSAREAAVDRETKRIQQSLHHLANGGAPRTPFERRIVKLFEATVPGKSNARYREAAEPGIIRYQRGIKERFRDGLERSGRYLGAIETVFEGYGLPVQLGRLPFVESSFNYEAYSSVGAAGIWQFMPATARKWMRVTSAIDERRDPIIATRAAAEYLRHSYSRLGNWPLAVTSYNHGLSGVMRGVRGVGSKDIVTLIHKYKGPAFGFASSNFYPELLAAIEVDRNAELYFPGLVREKPWEFDEVKLGRAIFFRDLVRFSGAPEAEMLQLNRAFMRPVSSNRTAIPAGSIVKVPKGRGRAVLASVSGSSMINLLGQSISSSAATSIRTASVAPPQVRQAGSVSPAGSGARYTVRSGDTIKAIAQRFQVSAPAIMEANGIRDPRRLRVGQELKIPGAASAPASATIVSPSRVSSSSRDYTVVAGDTLGGIAQRFGISVAELSQANGIGDPTSLRVGAKLNIPSGTSAQSSTSRESYTVVSGDTLSGIARKSGTSLSELRRLNPGLSTLLRPGQKIRVR